MELSITNRFFANTMGGDQHGLYFLLLANDNEIDKHFHDARPSVLKD